MLKKELEREITTRCKDIGFKKKSIIISINLLMKVYMQHLVLEWQH